MRRHVRDALFALGVLAALVVLLPVALAAQAAEWIREGSR